MNRDSVRKHLGNYLGFSPIRVLETQYFKTQMYVIHEGDSFECSRAHNVEGGTAVYKNERGGTVFCLVLSYADLDKFRSHFKEWLLGDDPPPLSPRTRVGKTGNKGLEAVTRRGEQVTSTYKVSIAKKSPIDRLLAIPEIHSNFLQFGEDYATAFIVTFASMAVHDYEHQQAEGLASGRARDYFVQERARAIARLRQCDEILGREQTIPRRNR